MKVLIIEDEKDLRLSMAQYIGAIGHVCELARDRATADEKLGTHDYDVVLLDITLPDGSGLDILHRIKEQGLDVGVLIISARDALEDKLKGLDLGADDYLTKPFHLSELNARINAIYRRRKADGRARITFEDLELDLASRSAFVNGAELRLTTKEFGLLQYLITNRGRVLTREAIAEHLWGDHIDMVDNFDFLYSHMKNLRKKIVHAGGADHVHTVYGIGYRFGGA